jgi:hypothetical protein
MRVLSSFVGGALLASACAATVPRAELDRCKLGIADGNEAYAARQGAACASVAKRLAADDEPVSRTRARHATSRTRVAAIST